MKLSLKFISLSFSFALLLLTSATAISDTSTTSAGLPLPTTIPKSETTNVTEPPQTVDVSTNGEARCPEGSILVGFNIVDNINAYRNLEGTKVQSKCLGLESKVTNKTSRLVVDPTKFTYTLICQPVGLDFY